MFTFVDSETAEVCIHLDHEESKKTELLRDVGDYERNEICQ